MNADRRRNQRGAQRLPSLRGHDLYSDRYRKPDTFYVYAYLDDARRVLYVGVTESPNTRNAEHHQKAPWYPLAAEFRVLWETTDRREAFAAEAKAIRELSPTFNIAHNRTAA